VKRPFLCALLLVLLLLLTLAACDGDDVVGPGDYGGWIEGYVGDGGDDLGSLRVHVWALGWDDEATIYTVVTDDDGYYRIGVPNGRAVIRAEGHEWAYYGADGLTTDVNEADTLLVDGVLRRVDFLMGRVRLFTENTEEARNYWDRAALVQVDEATDGDYFGRTRSFYLREDTLAAELRCVVPGPVFAGVATREFHQEFYWPGSYRVCDAETLLVEPGQLTDVEVTRPEPVSLSGHFEGVFREFGYTHAKIMAHLGSRNMAEARTDSLGNFTLVLPAAGDFWLSTVVEDSVYWRPGPIQYFDSLYRDDVTLYSLQNGESVVGLVCEKGALVIDLPGDPQIDGIRVEGYGLDDDSLRMWADWTTSFDPIHLVGITPGEYRLRLVPQGNFSPTWLGDVEAFEDAGSVNVLAGEISNVSVNLIRSGRILGRLLDAAGNPPTSSFNMVVHAADDQFFTYRTIDYHPLYCENDFEFDQTTGAFEILHIQPGQYKLRVLLPEQDSWIWYPDAESWADADVIDVPEGGDSGFIDWQL